MRVVIDARESGTSTGRYVDKLVEYMAKAKPEFEIIVLTKSHRLEFMRSVAPEFEVIPSDYKEFSLAEQLGFARQLYALKADLVHFSMTQQPLLYARRSVTTVHDLTTVRFTNTSKNWLGFKLKQQVYKVVIWWAAHKSRAVLTPSEFVKHDLARFARVGLSKITVTYEAADKIAAKPRTVSALSNERFLLYVGQAHPHKNLPQLIEAFETLAQTNPKLKLVIAGRKTPMMERLIKHVAGRENILFLGFVSEAQLRWLYENCAVYVFPSLSEGFGLPGLEAMAHGAPVAASRATCLPEIYGAAAHYFDPLDTGDMAKQIGELLNNKALRTKLIAAGRAQSARYSWADMAAKTLEVYRRYC